MTTSATRSTSMPALLPAVWSFRRADSRSGKLPCPLRGLEGAGRRSNQLTHLRTEDRSEDLFRPVRGTRLGGVDVQGSDDAVTVIPKRSEERGPDADPGAGVSVEPPAFLAQGFLDLHLLGGRDGLQTGPFPVQVPGGVDDRGIRCGGRQGERITVHEDRDAPPSWPGPAPWRRPRRRPAERAGPQGFSRTSASSSNAARTS
jgi:hypothetical protein